MWRNCVRRTTALFCAILILASAGPARAEGERWPPAIGAEDGDHLLRTTETPGADEAEQAAASPADAGPNDPVKITAPSAVLMEPLSGRVIYEKNAHEKRHPASVTKIMTLIVAFDALRDGKVKLKDPVTISEEAKRQPGTTIFADVGETFTFEELLLSVAVGSANDAAVAVAEHVAGSTEAFVALMNKKAQELGMKNTHFVNPTGLTAEGHLTTAYDIALMSRYAVLNYPELVKLTAIYGAELNVPWRKNGPKFQLWNNNKLLTWYKGADGLKTGWTQAAGYCLAATAVQGGTRMIAVVMGSESAKQRNIEVARLLDYGFANYAAVEIAPAGKKFGPVRVVRGSVASVEPVPRSAFGVSVPKGSQEKVKWEVKLPRQVAAPLREGQTVGEIVATLDGEVVGRMDLVSPVAVGKANLWQTIVHSVRGIFSFE
ncbi:MAG: D-alanyl-D-alanine carboxypeptidase family protein [Symbiobacterium sp.]|uniref:D-alanyl-D-alanine carboxypeptidase family protein n=1 Tax=Symbiobacterium sp. TaxID=1971213 RepID=UPI003463F0F5